MGTDPLYPLELPLASLLSLLFLLAALLAPSAYLLLADRCPADPPASPRASARPTPSSAKSAPLSIERKLPNTHGDAYSMHVSTACVQYFNARQASSTTCV